jgi:ribosomal protein S18 acetylase RimI-like enzyme
VVDHVTEVAGSVETERGPEFRDACILKRAVLESILTSPGSFLKTVADVDTMDADYWDKEIDTSTWVVIQQFDKVVGIAVARWPDKEMNRRINLARARNIESVWIAPIFRGSHMGERLVNYLMEVEREKYPKVRHFKLWVFKRNENAIRLYKRMGFKRTGVEHTLGDGTIELRYEYVLPNPSSKRAARRSRANAFARAGDLRQYGVTYRVLGRTSRSSG